MSTKVLNEEEWIAATEFERWEAHQNLVKLCKQLTKKNKLLEEDNQELRRKCKEHFNNAQTLMRYEFKLPDGYDFDRAQVNRTINAQVNGSDVTFSLPQ